MNRDFEAIAEQAAAWHAASLAEDMDWDGFTAWLEADPRHAAAYDEVALADALATEHGAGLALPVAANDEDAFDTPVARAHGWKRWAGVAIAASLVAVLVVPQIAVQPAAQVYATGDVARTVALDDGSRIIVAPHSRLDVGGRHQDRLALSGGAWFEIRHDPSRSMEISAGDLTISDIGTSFDVQATPRHVRVEVSEGVVSVSSERLSSRVQLAQGRALHFDGERGTSAVMPFDTKDAGEWRSGRLTYDSAPLALVVADLSRYAGVEVTLAPALGQRQFSGTLVIGNGETALRDLSQVMGVELGRSDGGYSLSELR